MSIIRLRIFFLKKLRKINLKIYKIALDFYDLLMDQSDDKLKNGNFSREEIFQGLKDVNIIFNKESLTTI